MHFMLLTSEYISHITRYSIVTLCPFSECEGSIAWLGDKSTGLGSLVVCIGRPMRELLDTFFSVISGAQLILHSCSLQYFHVHRSLKNRPWILAKGRTHPNITKKPHIYEFTNVYFS